LNPKLLKRARRKKKKPNLVCSLQLVQQNGG
jgi:hypothetical protein